MFSLRIVSTSHYQAEPLPDLDVVYSSFRSTDVRKVPILRIFGATPAGQKTCMHVHGVFPYLLVPYDGTQPADSYMRRFATSLDKAISVANNSNANTQHVFKISLVSGIPMYGYHGEEEQFLKIYLYNPSTVRKAADLLLGGAVMNKSFQPHEAHIPFPLQLFIDYNLYGMNLVNVAAVKFRRSHKGDGDAQRSKPSTSAGVGVIDLDSSSEEGGGGGCGSTPSFLRTPTSDSCSNTPSVTHWDMDNIPSEMLLPASVERQSVCELEVDVVAADILNRREVTDNMGSNPGLAALWEDERQRRRDAGQASQITPQESQEHHNVEASGSEHQLLQRLAEIIQQQRALSRSESEESAVSMEETTLTPEDVVSVPASQVEDHAQFVQDSQGSWQSSQDTVVLLEGGEEGEGAEGEDAPIISLESIQRVVSFSQSFSRPDSQSTSTPPDEEAADRSLVDVLAALAEESSPSASQRCAAHVSALEDQDSVVGHGISLPPDNAALQEDEEETLHMSQTLPQDLDGKSDHFDLEGLDATWNGSSGDEKDGDCAMESDDKEDDDDDDDDDIPQLDGTSDEKPASNKSSKKRLGARGPVLATGVEGAGSDGGTVQGEMSNPSSSPQMQSPIMPGANTPLQGDHGVASPHAQQQGAMAGQSQQMGGLYGQQQWGSAGGPANMGNMQQYQGHSSTASVWGQSPPPQGSYPGVYRPQGNNYGYYPYPQRYPYGSSFRPSGVQNSPRHANFSPPPRSPMSPPSYSNSGGFTRPQPGSSPQQFGSFAHPPQTQGAGMAAVRRHSEGSIAQPGAQFSSPTNWQYPAAGFNSSGSGQAMPAGPGYSMPSGSSQPMSLESWSTSFAGSSGPAQQNSSQTATGPGSYSSYPKPAGPAQQNNNQPQVSSNHPQTSSSQVCSEASSSSKLTESPHQPSTLQALLEAPDSSRVTHAQQCAPGGATHHRRAMSVDCNPSDIRASQQHQQFSRKGGQVFKYPEKRSGSFSSPSGSFAGGVQSSALSSLCSFVSSVDPMARTPTPTSRNSTPTPTLTPSSTPTSGPSPSVGNKEEDLAGFTDMLMGQVKRQPQQPSPHQLARSMSVEEASGARMGSLPAVSPLLPGCKGPGKDKPLGDQAGIPIKQETNSSSSEASTSSSSAAPAARTDRLGKQSRMRKLGLNLLKTRRVSEDSVASPPATTPVPPVTPTPCPSYTFTFQVPTPVYKRFKMRGVFPSRETEDIKVVRMHPMDARRYSLLKIGRELVRISRLSPRELRNVPVAFQARSTEGKCSNLDEHNSLIDPHTGELLSSLPDPPDVDKRKVTVQASQDAGKSKSGSPRRLMGPKCRRVQSTTDGSCQTTGAVADIGLPVKMESGQQAGPGIEPETCPSQQGFHSAGVPMGLIEGSLSDGVAVGMLGAHSGNAPVSMNDMPVNSGQPMMPPASGRNNGNQSWQTMDRDRRPTVKVEYPAQRPVNTGQWPGGQPPADSWGQGASPGNTMGQWGGQWQGGNYPPAWNPGTSGGPSYNCPPTIEGSGSKQQPVPNQYQYNVWSGSPSAPSAAFSSPSPSSTSAQPMPAVSSSPSASQSNMASPSYPHPYPPNYPGYGSGQFNQQAAFSSSGHPTSPGNKFTGYGNTGTGRMPYPGASPQGYQSGQSPGHSAFPPNHPSQAYSSPGGGKEGYPAGHQGGMMVQQGGLQGQFYQGQQQGQCMPPPTNPAHFQPNGGFSPHSGFSPSSSNPSHFAAGTHPSQFPTSSVNPTQFPSPSNQPGQFSSPTSQSGQFSAQQGQFCGQPGQISSSHSHPGQFSSPSGQTGQFTSPGQTGQFTSPSGQTGQFSSPGQTGQFSSHPNQTGQFSSPSNQPGHFSPSSHFGQFSPHSNQPTQMSPHAGYQGHFSPGTGQQNQFFAPGSHQGEQNAYQQYAGSEHFSHSAEFKPQASSGSSQNSGNVSFLDSVNQGNPFLRQGACQASTSTTSDPALPTGHSSKQMQPDRPRTTEMSEQHTHINQSHSGAKHTDKAEDDRCNSDKSSESRIFSVSKNSDSKISENSDDDFSKKDQKKFRGKFGSESSGSKKQKQADNKNSSVSQIARRSSVQLWSDGDSDSEDESDESDESSDDYRPTSNQWRGQKRKCSRPQNQTKSKRTKRSSVNYSARAFSKYLAHDAEKKCSRRGRPPKNHKAKKGSQQPLIEGIHYIVVGKFKGHKIMLVKVHKVQVSLHERVRVSEWQSQGQQSQAKPRTRLLGPRCKRLAKGTSAADPSFVQAGDKIASSENGGEDSDASTIVEDDCNSKTSSDGKHTTNANAECSLKKPKDEKQYKDENSQEFSSETVKNISSKSSHENVSSDSHSEHFHLSDANLKEIEKDEAEFDAQQNKEKCTEIVKNKENPKNCQARGDPTSIDCKSNKTQNILQDQSVEMQNTPSKTNAKTPSPLSHISNSASDQGETSGEAATDPATAMEVEANSKPSAWEPASRTQSPVAKPGKRPNDSPFIVSEHSQDADCSSLPQSNPDSASSSPVSPCIPLTTSTSSDKDSQLHYQLKSDTRLLDREQGRRESNGSSSGLFCFQTVCEKVKEVQASQRALEPSSDSSDSHACFSDMPAHGDGPHLQPQSVGFSWKEDLGSAKSIKPAEMDRDKLKKQKTLTTNQRLGVAFLSKRSRRRRNKVKAPSSKGENRNDTNKVLDSLSLLHMATLASLSGEHRSGNHNDPPSSPDCHAQDQVEEKENHNTDTSERACEWKTFNFNFGREDCERKTCVHTTVEADCEIFTLGKCTGSCGVENKTVYHEERKVISGISNELPESEIKLCDEPVTLASVSFDEEFGGGKDKQLYEYWNQETDDKTRLPKRTTNSQMKGYRKKRMKKKPTSQNKKTNKLLDSLDVLHFATLASLGSDPPRTDQSDTSLPRYGDCVSDHTDQYEESLIRMSYTSPVHSDLGDLSPPIPLSPEELSKLDRVSELRQRTVPGRVRLDESRGTRMVRMSQLRAENAMELLPHVPPPLPLPAEETVCKVDSEREGLPVGDTAVSTQSFFAKSHTSDVATGEHAKEVSAAAVVVSTGHSSCPPRSTSSSHPCIPDPDTLPTPSIPWNHPLHVVTDGMDGGAWKDRVIHDALTEKYQSRSNSLGDQTSPSLGPHRDLHRTLDKTPPFSGVLPGLVPKTPPFSQRDARRISEREPFAPPVGISLGEGEKTLFCANVLHPSLSQANVTPPKSAAPYGEMFRFSDLTSHSHSVNSKTPPYVNVSQRDVSSVNSRTPPYANVSHSKVHNVGDKPPLFSSISDSSNNIDKVPPYSSVSPRDPARYEDKTPQVSSPQRNRWLSDRSNTDAVTETQRQSVCSNQSASSQSSYSPRGSGLSRTDMIISQMFKMESSTGTAKTPPSPDVGKSPVGVSKQGLVDGALAADKNGWRPYLSLESGSLKDGPQYHYRQLSSGAKSPASYSPGRSLARSTSYSPGRSPARSTSTFFPDRLPSSQRPITSFSSDRYDQSGRPSSVYSHASQKSPAAYSDKFYSNAKSPSAYAERYKNAKSPSAYADKYNYIHAKSPSAYYSRSKSPSAYYSTSKSPSASQSHSSVKSPSASQSHSSVKSPGSCSAEGNKAPGVSLEKIKEAYAKSPSAYSNDSFNGSGKSQYRYTPEKYGFSPRSSHGLTPEKTSVTRTSFPHERSLSMSKSPMGSSPGSVFNGSNKSPAGTSPRQSNSSELENSKHCRTDAWLQQNRKRSIGEYLEEIIESTFAEMTPVLSKYSPPKVPHSDSVSRGQSQGLASSSLEKSTYHNTTSACAAADQEIMTKDRSTALDLTAPSKKQEAVGAGVTSVDTQRLSSVLSSTTVTYTSSMPSVCTTAISLSRPTWTSIKTDNFENITDDEDEDVIPSSQEYSTSAYRFPGFRRLSNISSSWSPYSLQNQSFVYAVSRPRPDLSKDGSGGMSVSATLMSSHGYPSGLYRQYDKGMYSQAAGVASASKASSAAAGSSVSAGPDKYCVTTNSAASQSVSHTLVTSFGTPWHDTPVQSSGPSTSIMSQFEPITDSEEEDNDKTEEDSLTVSLSSASQYRPVYFPAPYSSAAFYPAYNTSRTAASYSSTSGSSMMMSSHTNCPVTREATDSRLSSSSSAPRQEGYVYSTSVGSLAVYSSPASGTHSSVAGHFETCSSTLVSSSGVHSALENIGGKRTAGSLVCAGGDGDKHDSDPEDAGGRKKKKISGTPPLDPPPSFSSSSSSSARAGDQQEGQEEREDDGSDERRSGDKEATELTTVRSKLVLCPRAPPPSRRTVEASAVSVGLSVDPVTRAFCSHPADLPDKPRELGGRVLRLASNRITELEEMAAPEDGKGFREWQSLLASTSRLLSSQPDPPAASFAQRLQKEPQLRFALGGDGPCVITPVKPPPRRSSVTSWLEDKLRSIGSSGKGAAGVEAVEQRDGVSPDTDSSLPLDIDVPVEESQETGGKDSSDEDDSMFTRLRNKHRDTGEETSRKTHHSGDSSDDKGEGGSTPKRQRLDSDDILHSTPVRRSSTELFTSGCTPIAGGQRAEGDARESEGTRTEFITPKRPPLRRLSTNTESTLRRAILTSESRQQSLEGEMSQIDGPTPKNTHGFKVTQQKLQDAKALHKHQFLTVLSMEIHADSRGDLVPDPEVDAIRVIFYAVFDDIPPERGRRNITGAIVVDKESCAADSSRRGPQPSTSKAGTGSPGRGRGKQALLEKSGVLQDLDVTYVKSEGDLLQQFSELISSLDPDILLGFEIQQMSWGFLLHRAAHLNFNLCSNIARIQGSKRGNRFSAEKDEWGADHSSEIHIEGRIVLNLWRILRHEVTLNIYTYENCAFHVLHRRVPTYSFRCLTSWYNHRTQLHRWRVVEHYVQRVSGQLAMLDQLDIIGKTSEFARVFGIEFYDVLSRGTQYRVESMMLRLAKPLNFIPVSPSVQQRARQKAPECIPLTLEPQSRFYTDPMVVLDFQSLYPSIMIAYNYCFSTCLGRLEHLAKAQDGPIEFGCTSLNIPPDTLRKLRKKVTVSPNGCVFVTSKVRRGVLPMMVEEILKTRLMVKKSMKDYKDDKTLRRMLDARQLGLKLIANVTYGYTGASFSGRMPCIEVGDSIVRKARESLERAIQLVEDTPHWQARVVYGDTDSLFILLPGRSKDEAFVIGQEIADAVTDMFPKPMKLRFEKVYLPCALQTKKRYVGFMYESRDQKDPVFDAKGIETVRRDNCGVVSKVLERCIKILFTMRDVSQVRMYLQRQFFKMLSGRVGLHDYVFAKEYRGIMGYKPGACVPALEIARKRLREDRRAEPRVGERVPYVIVHGSPGLPLIQLVRQPRELLSDASLRINVTYYITKQVLPPLDRLLGLVGVSVFQWYNDMPKVVRLAPHVAPTQDTKQGTISQYFVTSDCLVCEQQTKQAVCASCLKDPQVVAVSLASCSAAWESVHDKLAQVCITCMGVQDHSQPCVSLDCPVLFRRHLAACDLARAEQRREALLKVLSY